MEQADLRSWERQCTQDDMPKCRAACPLQMDVRPFLERMAHGDTPGARKVLERHLPLPGVLGRICEHPCETACVRQELGGPLAVGALERVCVSQCAQQTRNLPRPGHAPWNLPGAGRGVGSFPKGISRRFVLCGRTSCGRFDRRIPRADAGSAGRRTRSHAEERRDADPRRA